MSMSSSLLPALLLAATAAAGESPPTVKPGCARSCGGVDIPYPFGIGTGCYRKGFEIACVNNGSSGDVPVLATTSQAIRVLNLSVAPRPVARVMLPVAWKCFDSDNNETGKFYGDVNVNPEGVYRISDAMNELYVLGCNTMAYTNSGNTGRRKYMYYTGCMSYSNDSSGPRDGACAGIGCCRVDIPPGLTDNAMTFFSGSGSSWSHADQVEFCPCDYAFIVERGNYTFRAADLTGMPRNQTMPLVLDWAIRDNSSATSSMSCAQAQAASNQLDYACVSRHSECVDSAIVGPGYVCNCTKGYEGNPYVVGRCTNIDECARPEEFPCHGVCTDKEGSYDCKCRKGYESDDPKAKPCTPKLSRSAKLAIGITVGTAVLILYIIGVGVRFMLKRIEQKAKEEALKAIEKKNGGDILKNVKTLMFFTEEELQEVTRNNSEPLGHGAFGQVYKGTLGENTMVAVKASLEVNQHIQGEFVKEVELQSRMLHKNILKLLGCCLRVKNPLLVYEYAAKGSLEDILHGNGSQQSHPLPLGSRLDIAIGSAQGLAYMHSYTEQDIQHADVKPSNILLDAQLVPKISDFGLSKMLTAGNDFAENVVGYLPYMDPVYKDTRLLTPKSDVYSFGIVLLELICRKPAVFGDSRLIHQFKRTFEQYKSGRAMFDKEITSIEADIPIIEEISILAMKCLNEDVKERPTMVSVASALVLLKEKWEKQASYRHEAIASNGAP
ncbi:hypothetical protein ACP70R_032311 [Stipagrostis hirtigluma subsp. patula]